MIFVWKFEKDKQPAKEFGAEDGIQDVECWMSVLSFRCAQCLADLSSATR